MQMNWTIPGTVLTAPRAEAIHIEEQFRAMFFAGGMVLSQVSNITGLESYIIQNWVKRGFLTKQQSLLSSSAWKITVPRSQTRTPCQPLQSPVWP